PRSARSPRRAAAAPCPCPARRSHPARRARRAGEWCSNRHRELRQASSSILGPPSEGRLNLNGALARVREREATARAPHQRGLSRAWPLLLLRTDAVPGSVFFELPRRGSV